jgi:dynein heavy chain
MKSLLRMAGKLLRLASADTSEHTILKNALKNFNLPRVVTDDKPIFEQLCEDLFPNVPLQYELDKNMIDAARFVLTSPEYIKKYQLNYTSENEFIPKICQIAEILEVRHGMFIIGPAGSGKTSVIRTLNAALNKLGQPTRVEYLNPKAIERTELFG